MYIRRYILMSFALKDYVSSSGHNSTIEQHARQTRTYFLKRLATHRPKRLTDNISLPTNLSHGYGKTCGIMWDKVGYICGYMCKGSHRVMISKCPYPPPCSANNSSAAASSAAIRSSEVFFERRYS